MEQKQEWFISLGMGFRGPFTTEQVQQQLKSAEVGRDNLVWADGLHDWLPLVKVDVFESLALKGVPFVHESPWMEEGEHEFSAILKGIPGQNPGFTEAPPSTWPEARPQGFFRKLLSAFRQRFSK